MILEVDTRVDRVEIGLFLVLGNTQVLSKSMNDGGWNVQGFIGTDFRDGFYAEIWRIDFLSLRFVLDLDVVHVEII